MIWLRVGNCETDLMARGRKRPTPEPLRVSIHPYQWEGSKCFVWIHSCIHVETVSLGKITDRRWSRVAPTRGVHDPGRGSKWTWYFGYSGTAEWKLALNCGTACWVSWFETQADGCQQVSFGDRLSNIIIGTSQRMRSGSDRLSKALRPASDGGSAYHHTVTPSGGTGLMDNGKVCQGNAGAKSFW